VLMFGAGEPKGRSAVTSKPKRLLAADEALPRCCEARAAAALAPRPRCGCAGGRKGGGGVASRGEGVGLEEEAREAGAKRREGRRGVCVVVSEGVAAAGGGDALASRPYAAARECGVEGPGALPLAETDMLLALRRTLGMALVLPPARGVEGAAAAEGAATCCCGGGGGGGGGGAEGCAATAASPSAAASLIDASAAGTSGCGDATAGRAACPPTRAMAECGAAERAVEAGCRRGAQERGVCGLVSRERRTLGARCDAGRLDGRREGAVQDAAPGRGWWWNEQGKRAHMRRAFESGRPSQGSSLNPAWPVRQAEYNEGQANVSSAAATFHSSL
jgi:hypothetical protein